MTTTAISQRLRVQRDRLDTAVWTVTGWLPWVRQIRRLEMQLDEANGSIARLARALADATRP